ncbi:uncharacterized protein F4812DRAFT_391008 [Daldinia caldariorum]|uniref:uncharacterized protein n=1 Tax=Daldinia caldariorum TaxID=326644 RepID=UPI0020072A9F|nr:uncharacterized protein F4812DRAFT_391008 [Daldinia caldariorum]KAI1468107.1 hypothetical protein F4812DRAFT_391008 [Daldinia caldariorum]
MSSALDFLSLLPPEQQQPILNGPALAPPSKDVVPNFENPPNMNRLVVAVVTVGLAIVTIAVFLRAYVKIWIVKNPQIQDAIGLLSYGAFIGYSYCIYRFAATSGMFVHQWNFLVRDLSGMIYIVQLAVNFYAIVLILLKTAILIDWVQMFIPRGTRGVFFWTCYGILLFNFLFYFSSEIAGNLSCIPFARIWDKTIPGKCFDRNPLDLTTASVNVVCDLFILIAPQKIIWGLHLTREKKIGVSIVYAIGLLSIIFAIVRLGLSIHHLSSQDWTFNISQVALLSFAELAFGILVFCIPAIPKAFKESKLLGRMVSSTTRIKTMDAATWSTSQLRKNPDGIGEYNRMEHPDNEISLADFHSGDSHGRSSAGIIKGNRDGDERGWGGIARTTQVTISVEQQNKHPEGNGFDGNSHPWASDRV